MRLYAEKIFRVQSFLRVEKTVFGKHGRIRCNLF